MVFKGSRVCIRLQYVGDGVEFAQQLFRLFRLPNHAAMRKY